MIETLLAAGAGKEAAFVIRHWIADRDSEAIAARSKGSGELVRTASIWGELA